MTSIGQNFCPGCGTDLPQNSKYCPECGRDFQSSSQTDGSTRQERNIPIEVKSNGLTVETEHINVDNIAFLHVHKRSLRIITIIIFLGLASLFGFIAASAASQLSLQSPSFIGIGAFFVTIAYVGFMFYSQNSFLIGTVTENKQAAGNSLKSAIGDFTDKSGEYIELKNTNRNLFHKSRYKYYLVPDNIVSVSRKNHSLLGFVIITVVATIGFVAAITYSSNLLVIFMSLFILMTVSLLTVWGFLFGSDSVEIKFQSGEKLSFAMTSQDTDELINEFKQRG